MTIITEENDTYHKAEGVSKSGLWSLYTKTPFHYKYGKRKSNPDFDVGSAVHCAILEPEEYEARYHKGPDDRKGNKWKEAQDYAAYMNQTCLTSGDYEDALLMRDVASTCSALQAMLEGDRVIEQSAYMTDEETGVVVRCKPDVYNRDNRFILDLKTAKTASLSGFSKAVAEYGYHVQDALYTHVWAKAGGGQVDGFFFVVIEKSEPPMVSVMELDAEAVAEGWAIYRKALARYAQCAASDQWPGYPADVQKVSLRRWDYRETEARSA